SSLAGICCAYSGVHTNSTALNPTNVLSHFTEQSLGLITLVSLGTAECLANSAFSCWSLVTCHSSLFATTGSAGADYYIKRLGPTEEQAKRIRELLRSK